MSRILKYSSSEYGEVFNPFAEGKKGLFHVMVVAYVFVWLCTMSWLVNRIAHRVLCGLNSVLFIKSHLRGDLFNFIAVYYLKHSIDT